MIKDLETYQDMKDYLNSLTDEELKQPIQTAYPGPMLAEPVAMKCGIAIGTMDDFEFYAARSVTDNKFHPEEIVILVDGSGFGEDGATSYTMMPSKKRKKPKTKEKDFDFKEYMKESMIPNYGPDGPTPKEAQLNPKFQTNEGLKIELMDSKHVEKSIDYVCKTTDKKRATLRGGSKKII